MCEDTGTCVCYVLNQQKRTELICEVTGTCVCKVSNQQKRLEFMCEVIGTCVCYVSNQQKRTVLMRGRHMWMVCKDTIYGCHAWVQLANGGCHA